MKLLLDENIPFSYLKELKKSHDVEHINQHCKGFTDIQVLEYALKKKRMIVTLDSDFCNFRKKEHYGIIKICGDVANPLDALCELLNNIRHAEVKDVYFQIGGNKKVYKEEKLYSKKRHKFKHFKRIPIILQCIKFNS